MIDIEKILKANTDVDDYRIVTTETESYEVFFVHRKLETVRATDTASTDVTVYVAHDGALGDSSFTLYGSMTEADAAQKVASAAQRAKLVANKAYALPEGGEAQAELPTNFKDLSLPELAEKIADAVFAADSYQGGSINATEIFLYKDTTTVINSRGIRKTQVKHHAMIEAIPTWNEGEESVELYESHRFTEFDAAAVTAEIDRKMREVRDRQNAVKPQTPQTVNVVLTPHEIESFLRRLTRQAEFSQVYAQANLYHVGDDLQTGSIGDKLTLTMTGAIPGSVQSAAFDTDGVDLTEKVILKDGKLEGYYGSSRYAQYLGETSTGNLGCMKLEPGTLTEQELKAAPYVECASLSGLQVDLYNDYIGGEIRLAYYFDGEKTVPITGISMSAKVSDVFSALKLSDTAVVSGSYQGPEKLLMKNVTIL